jgi:cytoskeleton protein RodZ
MASTAQKSIGEQLRAAREARGWTLGEAAKRTKVKSEQLDKLEKNQFDLLPSLAYARGFIRIYARELGLDGWALLRQFHGEIDSGYDTIDLQPQDLEAIPKRHQPSAPTSQSIGLVIIVGILLIALAIGSVQLYRAWQENAARQAAAAAPQTDLVQAEPAPVAPSAAAPAQPPRAAVVGGAPPVLAAQPVAVPESVPAAVPAAVPVAVPVAEPAVATGARTLQLQADPAAAENERWVRVIGIQGGQESTLFEGFLPAGQALPESAELWRADQFIITLREASAVDIIFNGTNFGRYDRPGVQRVTLPAQP